jgi:hypothetical protein
MLISASPGEPAYPTLDDSVSGHIRKTRLLARKLSGTSFNCWRTRV